MNNLPNSSDINNIMASVLQQNDAAIQMANLIQKSSVKFGDIKSLEYSVMQLDGVNRVIGAYTSTLASIVQSLVNIDDQINIREVSILEKTLQQVDKDGKITDKGGELKILRVVNDVNKMMSVVLDNSMKLGEKDLGFFALRRAKKNIAQSRVMLEETVSAMMSVLNSMVHNPTVLANLDVFGDIEEEVKENNELVIGKDSESKQYSITKKRAGILSIMNQLLSTMNTVSQFNPPSRFEMWIRLKKFKRALNQTTDMLIGCINDTMLKEGAVLGEDEQKLINGQIDIIIKFSEGITKIIDSLAKSSTGINKKQKSIKKLLELWYNPNEDKNFAIYNFLYDFVKSEKFTEITKDKKSILSNLETVEKIVESFKNITKNLILVGLMSIVIWATQKIILVTIDVLANVITKLASLDNKVIVGACNNMESLMSITKGLTAASLLLLGLSILVLPALLGVLATILLLQSLSFVLNVLGSKSFTQDVKQASKNILKLLVVFGSLFLVTGTILLFGEFVLEFWKPLLGGLIATLVLLGSVWLMFTIINSIGKSGIKSILSLIIITLAMTLIVGITALILLVAQMAEGISWEAFGKIAAILGGFILIVVLAGVLSSLIITGAAAMMLVGMAMILMVLPLVMLFGVLEMMESFDATNAMENMKAVLTGFISTLGSLFTPANLLGVMLAMASMGPLTIVALGLSAVVGAVALIDNVEINPESVSEKLTKVLTCVTDAIEQVNEVEVGLKTLAKFASLNLVSLSLAGMAATIAAVADLKMADKWDKDGKPINFIPMTEEHFTAATQNVVRIATAIAGCLTSPEMEDFLNTKYKKGEENLKLIGALGNSVGGMVQGVKAMAEGRIAIYEEDGKTIKEYIDIDKLLKDPKEQEKIKQNLQGLLSIYVEAVTNSELKKQSEGTGFFGLGASNIQKAATTLQSITNDVIPAMTEIINSTAGLIKNENLKTYLSGEAGQQNIEWLGRNLQSLLEVFIITSVNEFFVNQSYLVLQRLNDNLIPTLDQFLKSVDDLLNLESSKTYLFGSVGAENSKLLGVNLTALFENMMIINGQSLPVMVNARKKLSIMVDIANDYNKLFRKIAKLEPYMKPMDNVIKTYKKQVDDYIDIIQKIKSISLENLTEVETIMGRIQQLFQNGVSIVTSGGGLFRRKTTTVVDNFKKPLESITKIVDKVNSVDTEKVKSTADMFTQISKLSESIKGNFDGLAKALNENLMEVLEELRDILEQTNGIIENRPSNSTSTQMPQIQNISPASQNTAPQKAVDMTPVIEKLEGLLQAFKGGVPVYNKVGTRLQINTTV